MCKGFQMETHIQCIFNGNWQTAGNGVRIRIFEEADKGFEQGDKNLITLVFFEYRVKHKTST